ncbi:MAG TPA: ComEC/Rec2 family competence protein, partial [Ktedonobacterales bacterium]|nr:ComEC/Rec2 family competence protein [Ktedonobacterales bacterium]
MGETDIAGWKRPRWRLTGARLLDAARAERERWPLWLPVLMGAGIGAYFWLAREPALWLGPALLGIAALGVLAAWRSGRGRVAAAGLFALALGFCAAELQAHYVAAPVLERRVFGELEGKVLAVDPLPEGARLTVAPTSLAGLDQLPARVRIRLRRDDGGAAPGDAIRLKVAVEPPPAPAMPGAYDFERRAWFDRLGGVGYALGPPEVTPQAGGSWIEAVRHVVMSRIRAALPGPDGAIAAALITGATHAIKPADAGAFRDAGLAHILVIAGLHMGMVAAA